MKSSTTTTTTSAFFFPLFFFSFFFLPFTSSRRLRVLTPSTHTKTNNNPSLSFILHLPLSRSSLHLSFPYPPFSLPLSCRRRRCRRRCRHVSSGHGPTFPLSR